jgi:5-methylcytosine-specific restriction endonuclease McrA
VQNDFETLAQRLINDLDTPHLEKHRVQKNRIEKYYAPRQRFNRWRDSIEGKAWKQQQFDSIAGKCPGCGVTFTIGHFVIDHIKPLRSHPALAIELGNLQLLCHPCNLSKGSAI